MTMFRIGILLIIFVTLCVSVLYGVFDPMAKECDFVAKTTDMICPRYVDLVIALILIISAIFTFFGTMSIDGAQNSDGSFREQRIRFSIAASILVTYLIYFGMAIMWGDDPGGSKVFGTFTDLMMVVIPFYFASSAAVEWSKNKD